MAYVGLWRSLAKMMTQVQKLSRFDPGVTGLLEPFRGVGC